MENEAAEGLKNRNRRRRKMILFRSQLIAPTVFVILLDLILAHWCWPWYGSLSLSPQDNRDVLIAISGVACVVWTGAVVAYTLRKKFTSELSIGIGFLQAAFMQPLVCLVADGATLRTIASLVFALFGALGVRMFWTASKTKDLHLAMNGTFRVDDGGSLTESQVRTFSRRMTVIVGVINRLRDSHYLFIAIALSAIVVFFFPEPIGSAWCSIALLFIGLVHTYAVLFYWAGAESEEIETTPFIQFIGAHPVTDFASARDQQKTASNATSKLKVES